MYTPVTDSAASLSWVMDFKKVSLDANFLNLFTREFERLILPGYKAGVQVAGMESGALPLLAALRLAYPEKIVNSFYIRKSRKKKDLAKQIEGVVMEGVPIILVDDVLNSGSTFLKQIKILQEVNVSVAGIFSIIRFRDVEVYTQLFGGATGIVSVFELNDFSKTLGLKNLSGDTLATPHECYRPVWKVVTGKPNLLAVLPKSAPVVDVKKVYVGSDEGEMVAVSKETGDKVWGFSTFLKTKKGIYSSPLLFEDRVYFGAYDGNIYCLSAVDGSLVWVSFEGDFVGSSPALSEQHGLVFVGLEFGLFNRRGGLVAIDARSGKTVWIDRSISGFVHSSPAYSKKHDVVLCGSNNGSLYAWVAKTGKRIWEFKTGADIKMAPVISDDGDIVVLGSLDGGVYCLRVADGQLLYHFKAAAGFFAAPAIAGDVVIAGSLDKCIYAHDLKAKKMLWQYETAGRIFASPVVKDGKVFIGSNDGCLYGITITTGQVETKIQLTERIVNAVAIDGDDIYIATQACELYKFKHA